MTSAGQSKKITECKACGKEIASNAKSCPNCGAKNKKPIYKRVWFIVLCVIAILAIIGALGGDGDEGTSTQQAPDQTQGTEESSSQEESTNDEQEEATITYEEVSVDDLMSTLNDNALKAESTYNDAYVTITGRLGNIDSDGSYISILPSNDEWAFIGVQCFIENEEQLDQVMEMSIDDTVVVSGQITEVGEVIGYTLEIHSIG